MAASVNVVETRLLAPAVVDEDDQALLYRPVEQITGTPSMKTEWVEVTPEMADKWLRESDADQTFRQRTTKVRAVRRWQILMETDRFVHYLPNGPLCFDDQGVLLNGKHRLTALAGQSKAFGFMIVRQVPRFMFSFFDTGLPRSLNDVFHISGQATKTQTGSAMRLSMRYEEFLFGKRRPIGWKDWSQQRDEHHDVDDFLNRRVDLADGYYIGEQMHRGGKLVVASAMAFRFYQGLAWPEGSEEIVTFCDSLAKGSMLAPGAPALVLREWARQSQDQRERIRGKRELHLLLLFRYFALTAQGDRIERLQWAAGFPMTMPYHPQGSEVAVKNVIAALAEMDREAKQP